MRPLRLGPLPTSFNTACRAIASFQIIRFTPSHAQSARKCRSVPSTMVRRVGVRATSPAARVASTPTWMTTNFTVAKVHTPTVLIPAAVTPSLRIRLDLDPVRQATDADVVDDTPALALRRRLIPFHRDRTRHRGLLTPARTRAAPAQPRPLLDLDLDPALRPPLEEQEAARHRLCVTVGVVKPMVLTQTIVQWTEIIRIQLTTSPLEKAYFRPITI
eukprot:Rmarinus@m.6490